MSTKFQTDRWISYPLESRFPRLFELEQHKDYMIADRRVNRDQNWLWRHSNHMGEEGVQSSFLMELIQNVSFNLPTDRWCCEISEDRFLKF